MLTKSRTIQSSRTISFQIAKYQCLGPWTNSEAVASKNNMSWKTEWVMDLTMDSLEARPRCKYQNSIVTINSSRAFCPPSLESGRTSTSMSTSLYPSQWTILTLWIVSATMKERSLRWQNILTECIMVTMLGTFTSSRRLGILILITCSRVLLSFSKTIWNSWWGDLISTRG
jgi:hypothetical protein